MAVLFDSRSVQKCVTQIIYLGPLPTGVDERFRVLDEISFNFKPSKWVLKTDRNVDE